MPNMQNANVGYNTSITEQNIYVASTKHTSGCAMNKNYTPHDYKFAKALQESLAQDIENKKDLFKNPEDIELAKRIIRGQE
jgi:predicted transcriptional regulator of viral defense system